jgi:hypothetical protein
MSFPVILVIMSHIVESLRKQQKMIVLGVALAVVTLYVIPVDQIVSALHPGIQTAIDRIQDTRDRVSDNDRIPPNVKASIDYRLEAVQDRLAGLPINF